MTKDTISLMVKKINDLELLMARNNKINDLLPIEIKAILVKSLANIELPLVLLREFKIETTYKGPFGEKYTLPAQPDFNNPIVAALESTEGLFYLDFETKDGKVGSHSTGNIQTKTRK